ncbi:hypothetical protein J7L01_07305 [bacterium]|nr:hypothetical protein [bacterium]
MRKSVVLVIMIAALAFMLAGTASADVLFKYPVEANAALEVGTIVRLNSATDQVEKATDADRDIIGVVVGYELDGATHYVLVASSGQYPVQVVAPAVINAGDRLTMSATPAGYAETATNTEDVLIGIAMEDAVGSGLITVQIMIDDNQAQYSAYDHTGDHYITSDNVDGALGDLDSKIYDILAGTGTVNSLNPGDITTATNEGGGVWHVDVSTDAGDFVETGGVLALADNAIQSDEIEDGAIVNADVNASAAIAESKLALDYGTTALHDAIVANDGDILDLQTGTGLEDGTDAPDYSGTNYLTTTTNLEAADIVLDARVKANEDAIAGIAGGDLQDLTDGAGIADFTYDGSAAATVAIDNGWFNDDATVDASGAVTIQDDAVQASDIDFGTGGDQVDATDLTFTPTTPGDWTAAPTEAGGALDELANRVEGLEGGGADQNLNDVLTVGNSTGGLAFTDGSDGEVDVDDALSVVGNVTVADGETLFVDVIDAEGGASNFDLAAHMDLNGHYINNSDGSHYGGKVAFNDNIVPVMTGVQDLGYTTYRWDDIFVGATSVIDINGDAGAIGDVLTVDAAGSISWDSPTANLQNHSTGNGLTGVDYNGSAAVTWTVDPGTGITVDASGVNVDYGNSAGTAVQGNVAWSITAAGGLTGDANGVMGDGFSPTIAVGDGDGITVNADDIDVNVDGATIEISGDVLRVKANGINDTHIDWGSGASQVSAVDVPYDNATSGLTATEVQSAIDEIDATVDGIAGGGGQQTAMDQNDFSASPVALTATSWSDLTGVAITTTSDGNPIILNFSGTFDDRAGTSGAYIDIRITDGTNTSIKRTIILNDRNYHQTQEASINFRIGSPATASTTYKVEYQIHSNYNSGQCLNGTLTLLEING